MKKRLSVLKGLADLRKPHEWWMHARAHRRKIIHHIGPTNSGKTHAALHSLKQARRGVYLSPLRLLAAEVYEKLNAEGVPCSLVTGQERILVPGAQHTACTIETADLAVKYDVAVIDEIQMIEDRDRGSAWTNAFFGLMARQLHLTGDPRAKRIIQSLAKDTQEAVEFQPYERLSPLTFDEPVRQLRDLRPGDCIVAFSRKTCHLLRKYIDENLAGGCSIIYGSLPPGTRKDQAWRFNQRSDYKYLVATDAVGMGVNYKIDRVVFFETHKHDGKAVRRLFPHEVRQIAGRAGRHSRPGQVTAFTLPDLQYLQQCLADSRPWFISKAGLFPSFEHLEAFASDMPRGASYSRILRSFADLASVDKKFFFQNIADACVVADRIAKYRLSLEDTYIFAHSPVRVNMKASMTALERFAKELAERGQVRLRMQLPAGNLEDLEASYFVLELYTWLANKYGRNVFEDTDKALAFTQHCVQGIHECLNAIEVTDLNVLRNTGSA